MDTSILNNIDYDQLGEDLGVKKAEKKPQVMPEKLSGLAAEAFSLRDVDDRAKVVIEEFFAGNPKKFRQWSTDGNTLYYYESDVCTKEDGGYEISDVGYRTLTTKTIMNALMDYFAPGMSLESVRKDWRVHWQGKEYQWTGAMFFPGSSVGEDYIPLGRDKQPLPEAAPEAEVMKHRRELSRDITRDIKAIEARILEDGGDITIDDVVDVEKYGLEGGWTISDMLYDFLQQKGYKDPSHFLYGNWVDERDVKEIIDMRKDDVMPGRYQITYEYGDNGKTERRLMTDEELGDKSPDQLVSELTQAPHLTRNWDTIKRFLKECLMHKAITKKIKDETGIEYEVIRN